MGEPDWLTAVDGLLARGAFRGRDVDRTPYYRLMRKRLGREGTDGRTPDEERLADLLRPLWNVFRPTGPEPGPSAEGIDWSAFPSDVGPASWPSELVEALVGKLDAFPDPAIRARIREGLLACDRVERGAHQMALIRDLRDAGVAGVAGATGAELREPLELLAVARGQALRAKARGEQREIEDAIESVIVAAGDDDADGVLAAVLALRNSTGRRVGSGPLASETASRAVAILCRPGQWLEHPSNAILALRMAHWLSGQHNLGWEGMSLEERQVQELLAHAEMRFERGEALAAASFTEDALKIASNRGFDRVRVTNIHELVRRYNAEAVKGMKEHRVEIPIPPEEVARFEDYLDELRKLSRSSPCEALLLNAAINRPQLAPVRAAHLSAGPSLLDHIRGGTIVGDRSGVEADAEQRVLSQAFGLYRGFLLRRFAMGMNVIACECSADRLVEAVLGVPVLSVVDSEGVRQCLSAHLRGDYVAAVFIGTPQVELIVRGIVGQCGGERTTLKDKSQIESQLATLERELERVVRDSDVVTDWLKVCFSDRRGYNFRNELLHGNYLASAIGEGESLMVLHGILLLSGIAFGEEQCRPDGG
jgi:hypothetical protein